MKWRIKRVMSRLMPRAVGLVILCGLSLAATGRVAVAADVYEPDGHHYRARSLALDGPPQEHTFGTAADEDWLCFYGMKDQLYILESMDVGPRCNTVFELYNATGKKIDDGGVFANTHRTDYGEAEEVTWRCPAAGTYYLRVMQKDPVIFGIGTQYSLYLWDGTAPQNIPVPVFGEVTSSITLKAISGAEVRLIDLTGLDSDRVCVTEPMGLYELYAPNGEYRLEVRATGYKMQSKLVSVRGEAVENLFALVPTDTPKPDLAVPAVSGPATALAGSSVTVQYKLANKGEVPSKPFSVAIYLSQVRRVDFGRSRRVGFIRGINLDAGILCIRQDTVKIPSDLQTGTYWIVVAADPAGSIAESCETNNSRVSLDMMTVE
jgi:hypothetical protein